MTLLDSSFLISYLDGDPASVAYAEDHAGEAAKTIPLALYEVYLGELYTAGEPDFDAVEEALKWVTTVNSQSARYSRRAAELMSRLHDTGTQLAFRDGYIAAAAWELDETLATRDTDFDAPEVRDEIDVDLV